LFWFLYKILKREVILILIIHFQHYSRLEDVLVDSVWNEGAYDVKAHTIIEDSDLAASIPVIFDCELKVNKLCLLTNSKTKLLRRTEIACSVIVILVDRNLFTFHFNYLLSSLKVSLCF
jgi:hypothetical protein